MHLVGHRGAAGEAPHNQAEGFRRAWTAGVDRLEFDVWAGLDGRLLLAHDAGAAAHPGTLELEAGLAVLAQLGLPLHCDLKRFCPAASREIGRVLARWSWCLHPQLYVCSHSLADLHAFHQACPQARRLWSLPQVDLPGAELPPPDRPEGVAAVIQRTPQVAEAALRAGVCDGLAVQWLLATPQLRAVTHAYGAELQAWTVNPLEQALQLQELGVDGVTTDYPTRLAPELGRSPRLSAATGG